MTRSTIVTCVHCKRRLADRDYKSGDRWILQCEECHLWCCDNCIVFCDSDLHPSDDPEGLVSAYPLICEKTCGHWEHDPKTGEQQFFICNSCEGRYQRGLYVKAEVVEDEDSALL